MRHLLLVAFMMLIIATVSPMSEVVALSAYGDFPEGSQRYFNTLPPASKLPSDAECAVAIKPRPETKIANTTYNMTPGRQRLARNFFKSSDPRANSQIAVRVTGNFTGTTDEILQWVACKWGIDEDVVRAQVAAESGWRQASMGDWSGRAQRCAPGHRLGADGRSGLCPESWGAMQIKYYFYPSAWPGIVRSTAFNVDVAFAIWRACYEGYEIWLNDVERGKDYAAGDLWGCIGRWYVGRWYTPAAYRYTGIVSRRLSTRIWAQKGFSEN